MYLRSVVVVVLCTLFVAGFVLVLNFTAGNVGNTSQTGLATTHTTCDQQDPSCVSLAIVGASLKTVNYTDELGPVSYANLVIQLRVQGGSPVSSAAIFLGNSTVGRVSGPFSPGAVRVVNLTLPSTILVQPGKSYLVSVEGDYGQGQSAWATYRVEST